MQDYHFVLSHVLSYLETAQQSAGIAWVFRYSGSAIEYNAVMKISIHFVIGDTEGHDKLVGKYYMPCQSPLHMPLL